MSYCMWVMWNGNFLERSELGTWTNSWFARFLCLVAVWVFETRSVCLLWRGPDHWVQSLSIRSFTIYTEEVWNQLCLQMRRLSMDYADFVRCNPGSSRCSPLQTLFGTCAKQFWPLCRHNSRTLFCHLCTSWADLRSQCWIAKICIVAISDVTGSNEIGCLLMWADWALLSLLPYSAPAVTYRCFAVVGNREILMLLCVEAMFLSL